MKRLAHEFTITLYIYKTRSLFTRILALNEIEKNNNKERVYKCAVC